MMRFWWALIALFVVVAAAGVTSPPAAAATNGEAAVLQALIVAGAKTGNETPRVHTTYYPSDPFGFQWDIYGTAGAKVYAAFYSRTTTNTGGVSLVVENLGSTCGNLGYAGNTAKVTVKVDGQIVGVVKFGHLENINTAATRPWESIGNLTKKAYASQPGCWLANDSGIHTHLSVAHGCYVNRPVNQTVSGNAPLLVLSKTTYGSAHNGACVDSDVSKVNTATCERRQPNLWVKVGVELKATTGNDVVVGTGGDDRIYGYAGNDRICARGGADFVNAGSGNDRVFGQEGPDRLLGADGNDHIDGGGASDTLYGEAGQDTCVRGPGGAQTSGCETVK